MFRRQKETIVKKYAMCVHSVYFLASSAKEKKNAIHMCVPSLTLNAWSHAVIELSSRLDQSLESSYWHRVIAQGQSSDLHSSSIVYRLSHWLASRWHRVTRLGSISSLNKMLCGGRASHSVAKGSSAFLHLLC